jgi:hypothetical protein
MAILLELAKKITLKYCFNLNMQMTAYYKWQWAACFNIKFSVSLFCEEISKGGVK